MYEDTENYQGIISVEGKLKPYVLNTWDRTVAEVTNYTVEEGRTKIAIDVAPGEVITLILEKDGESQGELVEGSARFDGLLKSEEIELGDWKLVVDSFEEGDLLTRTETNEETGLTTTEVTYATNHVLMDAGTLNTLYPWKYLPSIGGEVSGIGIYENSFVLPENVLEENAVIEFSAGSFQGGTASIYVNDRKVSVNMDRCSADLTGFVKEGENTIRVEVTSSLRNVMIQKGYEQGWIMLEPEPDLYGMTGETKLLVLFGINANH